MARKLKVRLLGTLLVSMLGLLGGQSTHASLTDGLVAYWPFDENGGSTVFDVAGGNDGTINGGVSYVNSGIAPIPGNVNALSFDGESGYVAIPHATALDVTTAYTLAAWVNIADTDYRPIFTRGGSRPMTKLKSMAV